MTDSEREVARIRVEGRRADSHGALIDEAELRRGELWHRGLVVDAATVALVAMLAVAKDSVDLPALDDDELVSAEGRYMVMNAQVFRERFAAIGTPTAKQRKSP